MNYNNLISSSILDSYDDMINSTAQPQLLGGKRARKFVLPGTTNFDYPGSLSVGQGDRPNVASGGSFNTDFARKRRMASVRRAGIRDESESDEEGSDEDLMEGGFNFSKSMKSVGKALKPVAKVVKPIAKDILHEYVKSSMSAPAGGKRKQSVFGAIGKELGKAGKEVFREVIVPAGKEALKEKLKSGGKRKQSVFGSIGKELGKAGKEVFREVIVPAGKEALKEKLKKKEAGALLRNAPAQFQSHSYPKALASYKPKGVVTGGARSARGKIVSEVMKKHGLGLGAASKYVKEHNLY